MSTVKLENPPDPLKKLPPIRSMVYLFEKNPSGNYKFKAGEVIDLFEKPVAVKVRYATGSTYEGKMKSGWFRLDQLTASIPAVNQPEVEPFKGFDHA